MKFRVFMTSVLGAFLFGMIPTLANAHGGRTAADGCHNDKKAGARHCHGPKSKPEKYIPKTLYKGTSSVYYPNCSAARKAGKSQIRRGQAGYGRHLDRDGDGIACE